MEYDTGGNEILRRPHCNCGLTSGCYVCMGTFVFESVELTEEEV